MAIKATGHWPAFLKLIADIAALIGPSPKARAGREGGLAEAEIEGKAEKERERDDRETKNEKAPNGDDADAMYDLGVKYVLGAGVEGDSRKSSISTRK